MVFEFSLLGNIIYCYVVIHWQNEIGWALIICFVISDHIFDAILIFWPKFGLFWLKYVFFTKFKFLATICIYNVFWVKILIFEPNFHFVHTNFSYST